MMESHLVGKVAIVTGGSRGIGLEIAAALLARGAHVVVCGRSVEALSEARDQLSAGASDETHTRGQVECLAADVRNAAQARRLIDHAVERFGGLDLVINNAGVGHFREVAELTDDEWREVIDTNLSGPFHCCRAAIPALRRRGGGWIINISSLAGTHPFPGAAAYCASKSGLNAFSEALMQEVRYDDIRVSCVAPGSVGTGFAGHRKEPSAWKLSSSDVAQAVIDLLGHEPRSLPSRVEIRPSRPRK